MNFLLPDDCQSKLIFHKEFYFQPPLYLRYRWTPCTNTTIVTLKFTIDDLPLNSWCVMLSDFHGHYWIWHHVFLWLKNLPKNDATYYIHDVIEKTSLEWLFFWCVDISWQWSTKRTGTLRIARVFMVKKPWTFISHDDDVMAKHH